MTVHPLTGGRAHRTAACAAALLLAAAPATWPAPAESQEIGAALSRIAATVQTVPELKGKRVGVGDFPMANGRMTALGAFLADRLDVALTGRATASAFEVVTRSHLCQVIRENKLWVDDRFDPSLHTKLGKLGQADFLFAGQLTLLGKQVSLTVRVLDAETGRSVWADALTMPSDDALRRLATEALIGGGCEGGGAPTPPVPAPAGGGEPLRVKVWTDKAAFRLGDNIRFGLRVNRDAYVTLVNIGTSGDVTVIFPNRFHPDHFVRGGQDVLIPPADSGFTLTVQPPAGLEQVRAIATEERVQFQASDFGSGGAMFRSLDRAQTRNLVVGIKAERERIAPGKWAEEVIRVEVSR
jgi:hypothetical protein